MCLSCDPHRVISRSSIAMANDDAASGRIYIRDLPETGADYEGWRFTLQSQILLVAPDPVAAMAYMRELDDESVSFGDLASTLSTDMNKTDVNVFAAVVAACQKGKKGPEILKLTQSRAHFGCGRQAVRIVDQRHLHESTHLATEANTKIQELSCSGLAELDSYMASFSLCRHQVGSGEHKLTNAGGIALLKRKLKDIKQLDATFAVFNAGNSVDLDALICAINGVIAHHSEEIEKRKAKKAAAAAKTAAAIAAGGKTTATKQTSSAMNFGIRRPQSAEHAAAIITSNRRRVLNIWGERAMYPKCRIRIIHTQFVKRPSQMWRKPHISSVYHLCLTFGFNVMLKIQNIVGMQPAITHHDAKPPSRSELFMFLCQVIACRSKWAKIG